MAEFRILAASATAGPAASSATSFRPWKGSAAAATHAAAQASTAKRLSWAQSCQLASLPKRAFCTDTPDRFRALRPSVEVRAQAVALPEQSEESQLASASSSTEAQEGRVEKDLPQEWGVAGGAGSASVQGSNGAAQEGLPSKSGEEAPKYKKRLSPALKSRVG